MPSARGGGAEKSIIKMCNEISRRGINVELVLVKAEGVNLPYINKKVKVIDLNLSRSLFSIIKLTKYLIKANPDVLISAMKHANIPAIISTLLARNNGSKTKVIISERSNASQSLINNKSFKNTILLWMMKFFYPKADRVVGISKGVSEDIQTLIKLKSSKVCTIYNPVVENSLILKSQEKIRCAWFNDIKVPIVIAVGRLTKAKGFDNLINSFSVVLKETDSHLVILGEGEEREYLEILITELNLEKKISLPGYVDNPYKYLVNSKVFVLSSIWEGFGNVLVEALTCGCNVVSSDCPSGPKEIINVFKKGTLVPVNDIESMGIGILKELIADKDLTIRKKHFTTEACVDDYLNLVIDVCNND